MVEDRHVLDAELVPLSVAATVAYFHLADPRIQVEQAGSLLRAVGRAASRLRTSRRSTWAEPRGRRGR